MLRILELSSAQELFTRKARRLEDAERVVAPILDAVRTRGDDALLEYGRKFDNLREKTVRVHPGEFAAAKSHIHRDFVPAMEAAARNIREYAEMQLPRDSYFTTPDGRRLGQVVRPLESMGAYVPAGRYPLPSTLLMTVIPAQVAGVKTICVASPHPSSEILAACEFLGATQNVFRMGGAQAIAALAFGTETVPKVDRIVGPGNVYVTAAKKLLAGEVGIDFVAGPTEIVIIAEQGDPVHIAADMLAQAEHDVEASAILLTTSQPFADLVALEVNRQLETLPTSVVAREAIAKNSAVILVPSLE
ncbi:MAG: histidinol dehydrogenase, partial [Acidobacteriaceae bacterium]|nr:histidinol dehydrogenase [Acidobacteriaceae bacterium]